MRFSAEVQVYEQPVLDGKTGNIPGRTQCHVLTPNGEPMYRLTRIRIPKYYRLFRHPGCLDLLPCGIRL